MTDDDNPGNLDRRPRSNRPNIPPSDQVHIVSTCRRLGTAMWSGPDHWITQGYELRRLISMLYGIAATRIEFVAIDPNTRYDVALVLPHEEDQAALLVRIQKALERDLQLVVSKVKASRPVYVVTAPDGPGTKLVPAGTPGGGFVATRTSFTLPKDVSPSKEVFDQILNGPAIAQFVDSLSMCGTVSSLCATLEDTLGKPVINESRLQGYFEVQFRRGDMTRGQIFEHFRQAFGLVIAPQTRKVQSLRVQRNQASMTGSASPLS